MEDIHDLELASKSWSRMIDSASKAGYREGIEDGAQAVFQESFDKGYEDGFKIAFLLGQYKGLSTVLPNDFEYPLEIKEILKETKRGCCYICKSESNSVKTEGNEQLLEKIASCQREHTNKIITTLYNYFKPLMEKYGINIDHLVLL